MKELVSKAVALGLGIGVTGKEQAVRLAAKIEKQCGATKKDSLAFVTEVIRKGEVARTQLEQQVGALAKSILPVSRKEFETLKARMDKGAKKKKK